MVIDARCRPPTKEFQAAFRNRKPVSSLFTIASGVESPSFSQDSVELMFREMDGVRHYERSGCWKNKAKI